MNAKHLKTLLAEASQDGILLTQADDTSSLQSRRVIGYKSSIRALDRGDYDRHLPGGMRVVAAIFDAETSGYFTPDNETRVVLWRWLVAAVFINTMAEENGVAEVENESGGIDHPAMYFGEYGGISVYPFAERFSLANHIEAIAIEKYGVNNGYLMAVNMYQSMIAADCSLSEWGRESFQILHDSFIKQLNTDGLPPQPVTH